MKKIYIVTSGCYSDYGIDAVFTDKDVAQSFINSFKQDGYDDMGIEEWDLNPFDKQIKKGFKPYFVRMNKEGKSLDCRLEDNAYSFRAITKIDFDINNNLYIHIFAKDKEHAVKIANEHRGALIASDSWGRKTK